MPSRTLGSKLSSTVELRHLRYFVTVSEELSFTRAARRLHTAQPSLSNQIRQLEDEIGTPLLERTRHYVRLTLAGRVFLADAREILNRIDRAVSSAAHATGKSELYVFSFPAADVKVLPRLYPLIAERLPHLHLVTLSRYTIEPIAGLRQGTLDVAFLRGPVLESDLLITELAREPLMVLLPASHRLAHKRKIRPDRIEGLQCIRLPRLSGLYDAVTAFCASANVALHPDYQSDVAGQLQMVAVGLGFALLPDFVRSQLPPGVVMRPIDWDPVPTVSIVMARRREKRSERIDALIQLVDECFNPPDGVFPAPRPPVAAAPTTRAELPRPPIRWLSSDTSDANSGVPSAHRQ